MRRLSTILLALACAACLGAAGSTTVFKAGGVQSPRYAITKHVFATADTVRADSLIYPAAGTYTFHQVNAANGKIKWDCIRYNSTNGDSLTTVSAIDGSMVTTSYTGSTFPLGAADHYTSLLYFDWSDIPRGKRIVSAYLWVRCLKVADGGSGVRLASGDSLLACMDTTTADLSWLAGIGNRAMRALATWTELRDGQAGNWTPPWMNQKHWRKRGIVSAVTVGSPPPPQDPAAPDTLWRWVRFDVKPALEYWSAGGVNAGFKLTMIKSGAFNWFSLNPASPGRVAGVTRAHTPWMEISVSDAPLSGPWPGGSDVACSFVFDDGSGASWPRYARKADSLGIKITFAPETNDILDGGAGAAKPESLLAWHLRGHEIGNQGWFTDLRETGNGALANGPYNLHNFTTQLADPETISLQLTLSEALIATWGLPKPRTYVYPFAAMSAAMEESLWAHGYLAARGASKTTFSDNGFPTIDVGWDSCLVYRVPVIANPATRVEDPLYDPHLVVNGDEATTRANVRAWIAQARHWKNVQHGQLIVIYAHSYADLRFDEFAWLIDEMQDNGVWIDTFAANMTYWRRHHKPPADHRAAWTHFN